MRFSYKAILKLRENGYQVFANEKKNLMGLPIKTIFPKIVETIVDLNAQKDYYKEY